MKRCVVNKSERKEGWITYFSHHHVSLSLFLFLSCLLLLDEVEEEEAGGGRGVARFHASFLLPSLLFVQLSPFQGSGAAVSAAFRPD